MNFEEGGEENENDNISHRIKTKVIYYSSKK